MTSDYVTVTINISEDVTVGIDLNKVFSGMTSQQKEMVLNWILDDLGLEVREAKPLSGNLDDLGNRVDGMDGG